MRFIYQKKKNIIILKKGFKYAKIKEYKYMHKNTSKVDLSGFHQCNVIE